MKKNKTKEKVCVDFFSGWGGFSKAFEDRGWKVISTDIEKKFNTTICKDILKLEPDELPMEPDILLMSPPCECFSLLGSQHHWKNGNPNEETLFALSLVERALWLKDQIKPKFWVMENPRGLLRKLIGKPVITTYFAAWGSPTYKPTDIWGYLPEMVWAEPLIWEADDGNLSKSFRNKTASERAIIPYGLSLALCLATERELGESIRLVNHLGKGTKKRTVNKHNLLGENITIVI